mmetsp:Transcript_23289/g.33394  ORF Transcript_23289/g.33394 Transcript_23289/m.33394 type:complete len:135 (-) Transcript_23289:715-1119(-)
MSSSARDAIRNETEDLGDNQNQPKFICHSGLRLKARLWTLVTGGTFQKPQYFGVRPVFSDPQLCIRKLLGDFPELSPLVGVQGDPIRIVFSRVLTIHGADKRHRALGSVKDSGSGSRFCAGVQGWPGGSFQSSG